MVQKRLPVAARRSRVVILGAVCGCAAASAPGQTTIEWQNAAGGAWEHAANWAGGAKPGPADEARFGIGGASYMVSFAGDAQSAGVVVDGDEVTFDLTSRNFRFAPAGWDLSVGEGVASSRLSLQGGGFGAGPAAFTGSMTVGTMGRVDVNTAVLEGNDVAATVDGHLAVGAGGQVYLTGLSELVVNGLATVDGAGSFISPAEMRVTGELRATNGGWAAAGNGRLTLAPGAVVTADGGEIRGLDIEATGAQIDLANGGRLIAEFGPMNLNAGTMLTGNGQVLSDGSIANAGVVSPGTGGSGIGSLFFSNLEMSESGVLMMQLAGLEGGAGNDLVQAGVASLAGTLEVSLMSGFTPALGASYDLLTGTRLGEFSTVNLPTLDGGLSFDVVYGDDFVRLTVVPAPAAAAAGLLGLGIVGLRRRR
jgi:hypothetical protein